MTTTSSLRPEGKSRAGTSTIVVAVLLLALLGWRENILYNFTVGYAAAALLLPLWWSSLRHYRGAWLIVSLALVSLVSGVWLAEFMSATHAIDTDSYRGNSALLIGFVLTVGVVLWARRLMPLWAVGTAYGAGMLLGVSPTGLAEENLWKFGLLLPLVVLLLAAAVATGGRQVPGQQEPAIRLRQRIVECCVVLLAAAISALSDARSFFAMLLLVLVLVVWQLVPTGRSARVNVARAVIAFAGIAVLTFNIGVNLALEGFLGESAQQRSEAQLNQSGSLILGGRPELAATVALFLHRPAGFGVGVTPSLSDILVAKTGMAGINYQPNNGYVEGYMFGGHFELHSALGDLWVSFGLPGIALSLVVLVLVVARGLVGIAARNASAFVIFLVVYTTWNTFFSPLYSAVTVVALAVGLVAAPKLGSTEGGSASRPPTGLNHPVHPTSGRLSAR